ncbi:MAG: hypothetical protein IIC82_03880 [Chloroflexi bacterium]|nr:hypothetical protein [Chloroflexota bacterium]
MAEEVLAVPIFDEYRFFWNSEEGRIRDGGELSIDGGVCVIPLPRDEVVARVQKTLTPADGWVRNDESDVYITLDKAEVPERITLYFTLRTTDAATIITVKQGVYK